MGVNLPDRPRRFSLFRGNSLRLIAAGLLGGTLVGNGDIFAKIEGIEGESKALNREGWIDVAGLGSRVSFQSDTIDGRVRTRPTAEAFIFRKGIDKASPYLLKTMLEGRVFPELQIEQTAAGEVIGCYRMRGVWLTKHHLHTEPGETQPEEELSFGYDVIEWHYFRDPEPGGQSHFGSTWDFAVNGGGVLDQHGARTPTIAPIAPVEMMPGGTIQVQVQLLDPSGTPERLVFSALPSQNSLVKILSVTGKGLTRILTLEAGELLNG